jgi:hypothetical protein
MIVPARTIAGRGQDTTELFPMHKTTPRKKLNFILLKVPTVPMLKNPNL